MILLKKQEYHQAKKIINHQISHPPVFAQAVVERVIEGVVYTDPDSSECMLVGTDSGIYFLVGNESNESFNEFLSELYRKRKIKGKRFTLFSSSEKWDKVIKMINPDMLQMQRYSFSLDENPVLPEYSLPNEYKIKRISAESIKCSPEFPHSYYEEYWGSASNFLAKGFGYYCIYKGSIVSECTAIFSSGDSAEIDIATSKEYRGKGFGSVLAQYFISHCLENSKIPKWDCDVENRPSIELAQKLGFRKSGIYSVFV